MNPYENANSLKIISNSNTNNLKNKSLLNLKLIHKVFDSLNFSLLISIFLLSFISLNSQKKWTNIYVNLAKIRAKNNNLIDYISNLEEFYINKIESLNTLKKTTPKDLIYLDKSTSKKKNNYLNKKIKYIYEGLKDSKYQKGY